MPHSPLQMFHTPSFSPTFCPELEFKTLQTYQANPHTCCGIDWQEPRSLGWKSINLRPAGKQASLSALGVKTISPTKDEHCFYLQSNTTTAKLQSISLISKCSCITLQTEKNKWQDCSGPVHQTSLLEEILCSVHLQRTWHKADWPSQAESRQGKAPKLIRRST